MLRDGSVRCLGTRPALKPLHGAEPHEQGNGRAFPRGARARGALSAGPRRSARLPFGRGPVHDPIHAGVRHRPTGSRRKTGAPAVGAMRGLSRGASAEWPAIEVPRSGPPCAQLIPRLHPSIGPRRQRRRKAMQGQCDQGTRPGPAPTPRPEPAPGRRDRTPRTRALPPQRRSPAGPPSRGPDGPSAGRGNEGASAHPQAPKAGDPWRRGRLSREARRTAGPRPLPVRAGIRRGAPRSPRAPAARARSGRTPPGSRPRRAARRPRRARAGR